MRVTLRSYENLDELTSLRPSWDELLLNYPASTTFSTWEWLSCWWRCFGDDRRLLTLALFDSSSLVGLAPLSVSNERHGKFSLRVVRLMTDGSGDSDNLDLPVLPGFERTFTEAIIEYFRQHKQQWDVCMFNTLPPDSSVAQCLAEILRSSPWTFFEYSSRSSAVPLPETWDLYLQLLSSEDRKNLTRYTRRLESRYSTRIYRCKQEDQLLTCVEALFRLHQGRWQSAGEPGSFSSPQRREFYARLARLFLARGWLELWALELDGEIAAVQFAFRYRNTVFQLQEGYDHKRSSDRLGFVLRGEVLKQLISEKVRTYDFLGGEDRYKSRWGARQSHYRQIHFARPLGIGGMRLQYVDKTLRSKEWLRRKLPSSVWKLLHNVRMVVRGGRGTLSDGDPGLSN